jgi:hypothetical protein
MANTATTNYHPGLADEVVREIFAVLNVYRPNSPYTPAVREQMRETIELATELTAAKLMGKPYDIGYEGDNSGHRAGDRFDG